jgi:hypothetical protein
MLAGLTHDWGRGGHRAPHAAHACPFDVSHAIHVSSEDIAMLACQSEAVQRREACVRPGAARRDHAGEQHVTPTSACVCCCAERGYSFTTLPRGRL